MKIKFIQGINNEDLPALKEAFINAQKFRQHLSDVLEREISSIHASMRSEDNFKNPNWPYFQADRLGQEKALRTVLSLLRDENKI